MPINLSDINASVQQATTILTPKWFHRDLTGQGGKVGLLNENENPCLQADNNVHNRTLVQGNTKKWNAGDSAFRRIAFDPGFDCIKVPFAMKSDHCQDVTQKGCQRTSEVHLEPLGLVIEQNSALNTRNLIVGYRWSIYTTVDPTDSKYSYSNFPNLNRIFTFETTGPAADIDFIMTKFPASIDQRKLEEYLKSLSLYDMICEQARRWNHTIDQDVCSILDAIMTSQYPRTDALHALKHVFENMETYRVPLNLYRNIYQAIERSGLDDSEKKMLSNSNLNLLMNNVLSTLETKKQTMPCITPAGAIPVQSAQSTYSYEQQQAIESASPLTLIQAGAGTGKSTTLLGRIEYMMACGIKPETVLVLSFTNAAANNILTKQPLVRSSTIASMIHDLYQENFPAHKLSNPDTLINSLEIYFNKNQTPLVGEFGHCLSLIANNKDNGFTKTNALLDENLADIIALLNHMNQTCLELEILIMYQMMQTFKEPVGLNPSHIIMDEVQDTSVFEFIFVLEYSQRKNASLYMVGDASQTLYEFRFSNPKALNALEMSGIFETHALSTNYRSNQAILDFANIALADIEANHIANIQLQANQMTVDSSFEQKVAFQYCNMVKKRDLTNYISIEMSSNIKDWIDPLIARGEQVAFLAHARRSVNAIEESLKTLYPTKTISNLVPNKPYASTVISKYIKKFWNESKFLPIPGFLNALSQSVLSHLSDLVWGSKITPSLTQAVLRDFANLQVTHGSTIALLEQNVINGVMPKQTFLNEVQRILLDYEIRKNAAKFRLLQQENDDNKVDTSGDFVISTIHSAKGLEFPNVCVIYTATNHMEEADKRMYYVAFTRATKTMLVAAFDDLKYPVIQANYENLKEALKKSPIYNVTPTVTNVPPTVTLPPDDDTLPWDTDKIA